MTPTWKSHDKELRELAQLALLGNPLQRQEAIARLDEITASVPEADRRRVKDLYADYYSEGLMSTLPDDQGSFTKDMIKKSLLVQGGLGLIKAGAGIAQIVDAVSKESKIAPPKLPEGLEKNDLLASNITKAIYNSEQGDPKLREYYKSKVAEAETVDNFRAKVGGQLGQYASNIQANRLKKNDSLRSFALEEDKIRDRNESRLDRLTALDIREDNQIQNDRYRQFNARNNRYENNIQNLTAQRNSGLNNLFAGIGDVASTLPILTTGETKAPVSSTPLPNLRDGNPEPKIKNYEVGMLYNDAYRRRPDLVSRFRRMNNLEDDGRPWGPADTQAFDNMTTSNIFGNDFEGNNNVGLRWDSPRNIDFTQLGGI